MKAGLRLKATSIYTKGILPSYDPHVGSAKTPATRTSRERIDHLNVNTGMTAI